MAARFRRTEEVAFRRIGDECLLVPIRTTPKEGMAIFSLNSVGASLWEALNEPRSEDDLVERAIDEFEVERPEAQLDVHLFLAQLESKQLVIREER